MNAPNLPPPPIKLAYRRPDILCAQLVDCEKHFMRLRYQNKIYLQREHLLAYFFRSLEYYLRYPFAPDPCYAFIRLRRLLYSICCEGDITYEHLSAAQQVQLKYIIRAKNTMQLCVLLHKYLMYEQRGAHLSVLSFLIIKTISPIRRKQIQGYPFGLRFILLAIVLLVKLVKRPSRVWNKIAIKLKLKSYFFVF